MWQAYGLTELWPPNNGNVLWDKTGIPQKYRKEINIMCRKFLRIFVCLLLVCSMLTVPSFAESAVITGSKVNVRSGPGTEYYAIASLERNTPVDIVNRYSDAWYEINYNGILGYVSSAYLSTADSGSTGITVINLPQNTAVSSAPTPNTVSAPASDSSDDSSCYINAMYVRFRSGPGSTYSVVGEYNKGKEIKVVTTVGDWVAGYIDGNPGYVHKDYVSVGNTSSVGAQSVSSGIVVLSPSPTAVSDLPQPNESIKVVSPTTQPTAPIVVLPQPNATPTPTPAAAALNPEVIGDGVKGYIVGTYVRSRTGPGTNYSIVGTYNTGKELTVYTNCGNGWLFCSIDGREGYVHSNYVYIVPGSTASAGSSGVSQSLQVAVRTTEQPVSSAKKTGYITGNNVRFRAAASMTSQILGELFYGNQVTIIGTSGEWTQIVYGNDVGYVYSTYVKEGTYAAAEPTGSSGTVVSSNVTGQDIVNFAGQYLNYKYCWGGLSPETGFDCSGFVYYVYKHFGITVNRVAADQASNGVHVDPSDLRPGDILCFYSGSSYIGHAGIYIGNNKFIHASNSTTGVIISELSGYYASRGFEARRIVFN